MIKRLKMVLATGLMAALVVAGMPEGKLVPVVYADIDITDALPTDYITPKEKDEDTKEYGDFWYKETDNSITITYYTGSDASVTVPESINGKTVTVIGEGAFYSNNAQRNVEEIILPESIVEIGTKAFSNCKVLREINIPDGVISIGNTAFADCWSLAELDIPDSVKSIGTGAFKFCTSVKCFRLPDSIKSIPDYLFSGCVSLEDFVIPDGVTEIGSEAFCNCNSLKLIQLPESLKVIGSCAFRESGLDRIVIPKSVNSIGVQAFWYCGLDEIVILNSNVMFDDEFAMCDYSTVIKGYAGSTAETYANERNIQFVAIEDEAGIARVSGDSRFDTSIAVAEALKEELGISKFENVVVASATGYADALSGSYLASKKNAPVLLVADNAMEKMTGYIKENLATGGRVYVLGGTGAVSSKFEAMMGETYSIQRLAGSDRYQTNMAILKEAEVADEDILVCTGNGFADSLSASATNRPILLVPGKLMSYQKSYLESLEGDNTLYVIGGSGAVSLNVELQLKNYGSTKRLAGANRFETSVMIASEFFDEPKEVVLTYSQNFPDGLSAGPFAATKNVPLILCANNNVATSNAGVYCNNCTSNLENVYVIGGESLISDDTALNVYVASLK